MRVLIVEDDQDMIELLVLLLREMAGWTVVGYMDTARLLGAPELLDEADLLLVDLNMRPMSGPEFLERLRAQRDLACPVLFLTGREPDPEERALVDGAILKPFTYPELMARLRPFLGDEAPS